MADLTIYLNEKITLDGNDRGVLSTQTITGINNVDNRQIENEGRLNIKVIKNVKKY